MTFVNGFTDNPTNFKLPKGAILFSIIYNPMNKERNEYVVTYWIESKKIE